MPLQKLQFRAGINREGTTLANEGGWFEGDKIRFRSGFPEKIGGWAVLSYNTFLGVCRSLWCWITQKNFNLLGVGTNLKFYVESGGAYNDITPIRVVTGPSATPATDGPSFTTKEGSATVTIYDADASGVQANDFVTFVFPPATTVGGLDLNGEYQIATVISSAEYTITATDTAAADDTYGGTGEVDAYYQINIGSAVYTIGTGWGTGPWSPYVTATLTNPFATTNGSPTITVTQNAHGLTSGQYVFFQSISALTVGGVPSETFAKAFQVTVVNANSYTISTTGLGAWATPSVTNSSQGGTVVVDYPSATLTASANRGWGESYTVGIGQQLRLWSQATFGEYLLFNPRGGGIYIWQPGPGTTPGLLFRGVLLSPDSVIPTGSGWTSPVATDVTCPDLVNQILVSDAARIVIAFGTNDPSGTLFPALVSELDPLLVRWSAQEDYTVWTPNAATNQAGFFRLSRGSLIVGALQTRQEIIVWTDVAVYAMQYIGPPYIWSFNLLADNISIMSQNAMATASGVTYWMGTDKFYVYSGRVETLPCSLRTYVYDDINLDQETQIFASTNEAYSEIWWFYCSANSNIIDRYVIFNYLDRVWYYGTMNRTAWLDTGLRQYPLAATMETAYFTGSISGDTLTVTNVSYGSLYEGGSIVGIDVTPGTNIVKFLSGTGGTGTYKVSTEQNVPSTGMVGIFNNDNLVVYHEASPDDGISNPPSPIYSYVQSSDFDIGDGHNYGFVWRVIPDITFDGSTTTAPDTPTVQFELRPRQNPGSGYGVSNFPTVASSQDYTKKNYYNVQEFTEIVYTRVRGRQMAFKVISESLGTQWQLGVPRIDVRSDGRR